MFCFVFWQSYLLFLSLLSFTRSCPEEPSSALHLESLMWMIKEVIQTDERNDILFHQRSKCLIDSAVAVVRLALHSSAEGPRFKPQKNHILNGATLDSLYGLQFPHFVTNKGHHFFFSQKYLSRRLRIWIEICEVYKPFTCSHSDWGWTLLQVIHPPRNGTRNPGCGVYRSSQWNSARWLCWLLHWEVLQTQGQWKNKVMCQFVVIVK